MTYDVIEPSELDMELSFQRPAFPLPTADDLAYLESEHQRKYNPHLQDPNNPIRRRIIIERAIVRRAVMDLIAAGFTLTVDYGDDCYGIRESRDVNAIMPHIGAAEEEWLFCVRRTPSTRLTSAQSIYFVYGNSGWDVITDYSVSLESVLKGANDLAEELSAWRL